MSSRLFLARPPLAMGLLILFLTASSRSAQPAAEPTEPVRLTLSRVSAERSDTDILFRCDVVLSNATGAELKVKSNFSSAFDGLELVVFSEDGKRLRQQYYIFHQAPFSPDGRWFPLHKGENRKSLVFPVSTLPKGIKRVKVLLLGTLPGSEYHGILCSDVVSVTVERPKE